MSEPARKYDSSDKLFLSVKLISGDHVVVAKGALIGYCHCDAHKGYMTSALYRSHECRKKQCPFLERFETNQYWQTIDGQERKKALKKEQKREQRQEEAKKTGCT